MAKALFIGNDGNTLAVDAELGWTLMEVGRSNMVPGILGDCGGSCACASCHVIVDAAWIEKLEKPSENELSLLTLAEGVELNSRLGCQITMTVELDGIVLRVPER